MSAVSDEILDTVATGSYHAPHDVLGPHRLPDGTWLQAHREAGDVWFDIDVPAGEPSKWLTFHATRVLDWWESTNGVKKWRGR